MYLNLKMSRNTSIRSITALFKICMNTNVSGFVCIRLKLDLQHSVKGGRSVAKAEAKCSVKVMNSKQTMTWTGISAASFFNLFVEPGRIPTLELRRCTICVRTGTVCCPSAWQQIMQFVHLPPRVWSPLTKQSYSKLIRLTQCVRVLEERKHRPAYWVERWKTKADIFSRK